MCHVRQALSLKLGVATDRDLAQACRSAYRPWVNVCLWIIMEVQLPSRAQHYFWNKVL
jgi:manganese transport protein